MSHIYEQASQVIVWLGPTFPRSNAIIDEMQQVDITNEAQIVRYVVSLSSLDRSAIEHIMSMPYWGRLWICQEVVLARRVIVFVGQRNISFDVVASIAQLYMYQKLETSLNAKLSVDRVIELYNLRHYRCVGSWQQLAKLAMGSICENPLDSVYGLQGLLEPSTKIPVDYTKSVVEVFEEAVSRMEHFSHQLYMNYLERSLRLRDHLTEQQIDELYYKLTS
jgi:hypothetical protein